MCLVRVVDKKKKLIALSSSEAELYALLKGATQAKCVMSMLKDYGFLNGCTVHTDASAAMGITHRVGLGRTRHIDAVPLDTERSPTSR